MEEKYGTLHFGRGGGGRSIGSGRNGRGAFPFPFDSSDISSNLKDGCRRNCVLFFLALRAAATPAHKSTRRNEGENNDERMIARSWTFPCMDFDHVVQVTGRVTDIRFRSRCVVVSCCFIAIGGKTHHQHQTRPRIRYLDTKARVAHSSPTRDSQTDCCPSCLLRWFCSRAGVSPPAHLRLE